MIGAPILIAISTPTSLAVQMADAAGITVVAIAGASSFEVFTHPQRLAGPELRHGIVIPSRHLRSG